MANKMELGKVVTGLEGCSKSSHIFTEVEKIATRENPVIFGYKNHKLMDEQRNTFSSRFNIPIEEFAICGFNEQYEVAMQYYTNKEYPYQIPDKARFVFVTQATMQKNKHLSLFNETTGKVVKPIHIVVDEFDFTSGIIPTLDYYLNNLNIENNLLEETLGKWILKHYTSQDYMQIKLSKSRNDKGFVKAHWIEENHTIPLTFLTSEILSTKVLQVLGFRVEQFGNKDIEKDFKECLVKVWSSDLVTEEFMAEMNRAVAWNRLPYDLIISDKILSYYNVYNLATLDLDVITHTSIRGSNDHREKKILTILTHIPKAIICQIKDALDYYGQGMSYDEVETLFYRDRLCQAIGRTLGYRGGKETDLIVHSKLFNKIRELESFPYSFKEADLLSVLEDKNEIISKTKERKEAKKERKSISTSIKDLSHLDNYFFKTNSADNWLLVSEVKDYIMKHDIKGISGKYLAVSKVAKYFSVEQKTKMIKGKNYRIIIGVNFKL